jgi:pimeloyl-ACP methyl ester carboxylesterase
VSLFWIGLALMSSVPVLVDGYLFICFFKLRIKYLHLIVRIFQERPLFVVPRGAPWPGAEPVRFRTADGLTLAGCYLRTQRTRRGVILFGLEFGSNCWSCRPYCEHLVAAGYDVFAFESRNQGESEATPGYDPLQWVTEYEVIDTLAALDYLKGRPDADPRGVGFFGVSKGAGAGLVAASRDGCIRCCVTDGAFATYSTLVPYMRHWFRLYHSMHKLQSLLPSWYFGRIGLIGLRQIEQARHCRFPSLERAVGELSCPLLMIHGECDSYIKPTMARTLYDHAQGPKEFWQVQGAKHNQALHLAGEEYRGRVLRFFEQHLASIEVPERDSASGASTSVSCAKDRPAVEARS